MTYQKKIIGKLVDHDNWPWFERPDFLNELNELADKAFKNKTIDGYLAAVLIYHQLTEEFIKILIECSTFYIQLSVYPQEYNDRDLKKKMFGQLIGELKQSVLHEETSELIEKAVKLNDLRIKVVHKLTKNNTISSVEKNCEKVQTIFNEIWKLFMVIYDSYREIFRQFWKNRDSLIDRELI